MVKKFNLTQITEVSIGYVAERYELSVKYIDDSKYTYGQQNFLLETKEGCVVYFADILKTFGFTGDLSLYNFTMDNETNRLILNEKKLEDIKIRSGLKSIIEKEGKGKIDNFQPTNINGLYKIKNRDIFYRYLDNQLVELFDVKRSGSFEYKDTDEHEDFQTILTYNDKDLIRFFVKKTNEGYEYIEYFEDKMKNITLDPFKQDNKNTNNNKM